MKWLTRTRGCRARRGHAERSIFRALKTGGHLGRRDLLEGRGQGLSQLRRAEPRRHFHAEREVGPHVLPAALGVARVKDAEVQMVLELVGQADEQNVPLHGRHVAEAVPNAPRSSSWR